MSTDAIQLLFQGLYALVAGSYIFTFCAVAWAVDKINKLVISVTRLETNHLVHLQYEIDELKRKINAKDERGSSEGL